MPARGAQDPRASLEIGQTYTEQMKRSPVSTAKLLADTGLRLLEYK